jgi:hypothetical protein
MSTLHLSTAEQLGFGNDTIDELKVFLDELKVKR